MPNPTKAQDNALLLIQDSVVLTDMATSIYKVRRDMLNRMEKMGLVVWRHRSRGWRLTPAGRARCRAIAET